MEVLTFNSRDAIKSALHEVDETHFAFYSHALKTIGSNWNYHRKVYFKTRTDYIRALDYLDDLLTFILEKKNGR